MPLAAVLCFGCSKSEWVEAPSPMAVGQAPDVQTVVLAISDMIDRDVLGCDTYVDYTDGSGQRKTESLNGLSSPEIEILQGTDVAFRVHVWDPQGGKYTARCGMKTATRAARFIRKAKLPGSTI